MGKIKTSRRSFVTMAGAAAAVTALPKPSAASGRVVVATWGGDNERAIRESAGVAIKQRESIDVVFDVGTPSARKTKLIAESQRPRNNIDIIHLTDSDMFQMRRQNFLAELGPQNIRGYDKILDQFKTNYSVPTNFSALVLVYNKNKISSMTSWKDLWRDEYAGKIGFTDLSYDKIVPITAITFGGSASNYTPAYDALLDLKRKGVRVYPSNEACGNAFASEEIIAAIQWKGRAYQWSQAGLPLAYTIPKEGAFPTSFDMGITRNTGSPQQAAAFLSMMLEPASQLALAKAIGQAPVIRDSGLPVELEQTVGFTEKERGQFIPLDHGYAADNASKLLDWWNQKFKA